MIGLRSLIVVGVAVFEINAIVVSFISGGNCKVFIKWASLIEINWIKIGLIK